MRPVGSCKLCGRTLWTRAPCPCSAKPKQLRYTPKADRRTLSQLLREEREKRRSEGP